LQQLQEQSIKMKELKEEYTNLDMQQKEMAMIAEMQK
jgi:hypothetical protein